LVENGTPFKVGTLVMVRNLKKSLKKFIIDYNFLGPFKIKTMHSNGKVDLAHPTDTQQSVIKEFRNVLISILKLYVGEIVKFDEISIKSTRNVMIIIN
jgi:hypothetical protein